MNPRVRGATQPGQKSFKVNVHFLPQFLVPHGRGDARIPRKIEEILVAALRDRQSRSPRYSLRAFAQRLGVHSATISQIIRGQRFLSARGAQALARKLGCSAIQCAEVSSDARQAAHQRRVFRLVSRGCVAPVVRGLARRLRLSCDEIDAALTQLLIRGAVVMNSTTSWIVGEEKI